jgi:hypothetical protein
MSEHRLAAFKVRLMLTVAALGTLIVLVAP